MTRFLVGALALASARTALAGVASPETYSVPLCSGGSIYVQVVGSEDANFEISVASGWPIVRVDDQTGSCSDYEYAESNEEGELMPLGQAVSAAAPGAMGNRDFRQDLFNMYRGHHQEERRRLGFGFPTEQDIARRRQLSTGPS
jgi:hypothetical protein